LELAEGGDPVFPTNQMTYRVDLEGNLTLDSVRALEFLALENDTIDFGFTTAKIWLHFRVRNTSTTSITKVLRSSARFMRPLEISLLREDGTIESLLSNDETNRFGERPLPELRFLATQFTLEAGELANFYIRFGAGGRAAMTLQISDREQALNEQFRATTGIVMFCVILLTLMLVNFFHYLAIRKPAHLVYIVYESSNILYITHFEGFTFQYLWPNLPTLNDDATPIIASLGLIIGNIFAMVFLETRKYTPLIHRIILAFTALSISSLLVSILFGNMLGNQFAAILLPIALVLSVVAAAVVAKRGHYPARYFLVAWGLFAIAGVIWSGSILGVFGVSFNILTLFKISIAAQAIILYMGLANQAGRIKNQYMDTQKELIASLQGRLDDVRERIQLESKNEDINSQLQIKSKLLATTSHDINQPLQSLRAVVKSIEMKGGESKATSQLAETLDHMELVLGKSLDDASADLRESAERSQIQTVLAGALIRKVVASFLELASEKHLEIRGFCSNAIIVTQELPLTRCLMNLVSNAIENTDRGGVLIGARRRNESLVFQVFDTGHGFPNDRVVNLLKPMVKGDASSGHGLGLAIVSEICHEYGWQLEIHSQPSKGSCFSISVPVRT